LLAYANEELKPTGYSIRIFDYDGEGYYICEILKDGVSLEVYAENFYENELSDLVNEVWHYVLTEKIGK
jgi:hypothetical protein